MTAPSAARQGRPRGWSRVRALAPHAVLLAAGAALLPAYRFHTGLDGVAYLSLARHIAEGRFGEALNAYWGPLFPALTAPLIALGIPPVLAGHVTVLASGAVVIWAVVRLAVLLGASSQAANLVALATVPFLVWAMTFGVFADLLLAGLLLTYLSFVLDPRFRTDPGVGWRVGAVAGLAFLTKSYGLPVVLAHLPVAALLHGRGRTPAERPHLWTNLAAAGAVLVAVLAVWASVVSLSYGRVVLTTSAAHNVEIVSEGSPGNPIFHAGLMEPPTPNAVSVWDEPSTMPVDRGEDADAVGTGFLVRVGENVTRNVTEATSALLRLPGALTVVGLVALVAVLRRRRGVAALGLVAASAIYLVGYLPLWVEPRYLWFVPLSLAPLVALAASGSGRRWVPAAVAGVVAVGLAVPAVIDARVRWGSGEETRAIARQLELRGLEGRAVASATHWQRSAIVCLHARCRYHGVPHPEDRDDLLVQLRDHGIDHYLVWGYHPDVVTPSDGPYEGFGNLRLFELTPDEEPSP